MLQNTDQIIAVCKWTKVGFTHNIFEPYVRLKSKTYNCMRQALRKTSQRRMYK